MDDELLPLEDAAPIAGLDTSHLARLARGKQIPGAVKREKEGARGRWYIPRSWAEARSQRPTKADAVRELAKNHPEISRREIARRVDCDPGYVSRVLGPIDATPKAEPAPAPDLSGLKLYRLAAMTSKLVAVDPSGRAWRMPNRAGGWSARIGLSQVPPEFALTRLEAGEEAEARARLAGGEG